MRGFLSPFQRILAADKIETLVPGVKPLWLWPDWNDPASLWLSRRPVDARDAVGMVVRNPCLLTYAGPELLVAITRGAVSEEGLMDAYRDIMEFVERRGYGYLQTLLTDPELVAHILRNGSCPTDLDGMEIPDYALEKV